MMRKTFTALATLLGVVGIIQPAGAVLQISGTIGGIAVQCADQNFSCDTNPLAGQLAIGDQTIGGVQFIGSSQTQVIGGTSNSLNTSSFQIINNSGASVPIDLVVSGTDFASPTTFYSASGGGTFQSAVGSTIDMQFFADSTNQQGADNPTDTPGISLQSFSHTATLLTDTFAFNSGTQPLLESGPFSMTLFAAGTLVNGGSLVGRTQAIVTDVATSVPEPGSLAMMGTMLLMGATFLRRRRQE